MAVKERRSGMRQRVAFLMITAVVAVVAFGWSSVALSQQVEEESDNLLALDLALSSWASSPGDTVSLALTLTNSGSEAVLPEVTVQMPDQVLLDVARLPSGTSLNLQSGTLSWQPLVEPLGGFRRVELWMTVSVAEMKVPEKTITAIVKSGDVEWSQSATMWIGVLPQASISFDPPQVSVGQPVRLVPGIAGPGPLTQLWTLADGRVIAANDPVVMFPTSGEHRVNLEVSNPLGSTMVSNLITVSPQPIARFEIEDARTSGDLPVIFRNESGGERPLRYTWDFGDGTSSNDQHPEHIYAAPGNYQVRLAVENDFGFSETYSLVEVGFPPTLTIAISEFGEVGRLQLGQAVSDDAAAEITWDMGDGHTYSGPNVSHVYWLPGDYILTASVQNDFGETQVSQWVHVAPGILYYYIPFLMNGSSMDVSLGGINGPDSGQIPLEIGLGPMPELESILFPAGTSPAEQLFAYINEARRLFDLRPLTYVHPLSIAAQSHADDMAAYGHTSHTGSDGSSAAFRLQQAGYSGGYGGEATAWGMSDPIDPVQYWLTSPSHRAILLNPAVTEVGIGYTVNFDSPNVWYWTAEFASIDLPIVNASPPVAPTVVPVVQLQLLGPPQSSDFVISDETMLVFSWSWNGGLHDFQRFALYLKFQGRIFQVGVVRKFESSGQYQFSVMASDLAIAPGNYQWQVRLEDSAQGIVVVESPFWIVQFHGLQDNDPLPTPELTPTPVPTPEPTATIPPPGEPPLGQTPLPVSTPVPTPTP